MIESDTRPLTEAERKLLGAGRGLPDRWTAGFGPGIAAGTITLLLGLVLIAVAGWASEDAKRVAVAAGLLVGGGVYAHVAHLSRRVSPGPGPGDDLAAGIAEVRRYTVTDAIRVEELEDEGLSFFLALADGQVLFLSGQYLHGPVEDGAFPAARFEVVRTARTGTVLAIHSLGEHLAVSATRPPFTMAEYREGSVPEDGSVLPGPLDRYRAAAT